ncbi:MAG TPA: hypothetical protein VID51_08310 [Solirubrobacterales bacterium]
MALIAPQSRAFLVEMFTDLRADLESQMEEGGKGSPDSEEAARKLAMYEALLAGLTQSGPFPDDEAVRQYVVELAKATDEANGYEQAALEHQAFAELVAELAR